MKIETSLPSDTSVLYDALVERGFDCSESSRDEDSFMVETDKPERLRAVATQVAMDECMTLWIDEERVTRDGYKVRS